VDCRPTSRQFSPDEELGRNWMEGVSRYQARENGAP
jgi:hypothetical protein